MRRSLLALVILAGLMLPLVGCRTSREPVLVAPRTLVAPTVDLGERTWAVVPLGNESGTSLAQAELLSDQLVAAIEQTRGLRAIPLNRSFQALRALEMPGVRNLADAQRFGRALGADSVVAGSVTAWDPYTPQIGLTLVVFDLDPGTTGGVDPRRLQSAFASEERAGSEASDDNLTVVSLNLDGKNHQVQMDVRAYAQGRQRNESAAGWRRYLIAMPLFGEFAAYHAVDEVLKARWARLGLERPGGRGEGGGGPGESRVAGPRAER